VESLEILTNPIPERKRGRNKTYLAGTNSIDIKYNKIREIKENKKLVK
jgi:hypothetical protein